MPSYAPKNVDALLFSFRLLRAVFHYPKNILVQGKRIDAEKALREARAVHGVPSLVPADWQLVRRSPNGAEQVLATSVASYDIGADGAVVYTNGRGVFAIEPMDDEAGGDRGGGE